MERIAIDIDGTILPEGPRFDRYLKSPFSNSVETIIKLKEYGYTVFFFTSRSWSEYDITLKWLRDHGFVFDYLVCGKPIYDILVDDRSINSLEEILKRLLKV